MISSSKTAVLGGQTVVNFVLPDITELVEKEHSAYRSELVIERLCDCGFGPGNARSTEELLLKGICDAVTHDSIYVLHLS